jgi:hypothetical protein
MADLLNAPDDSVSIGLLQPSFSKLAVHAESIY